MILSDVMILLLGNFQGLLFGFMGGVFLALHMMGED